MPKSDVTPDPSAAWLVIGVKPTNARLEIDEPYLRKGVARSFHYSADGFSPIDGFIVVKARPDRVYGIAAFSRMLPGTIFGMRLLPCGEVPSFKASAGRVVYFTTANYRTADPEPEGMQSANFATHAFEAVTYTQDLEGARAFLRKHYPALSDSVEQGTAEMLRVADKCWDR